MNHNVSVIVDRARTNNQAPVREPVASEADGKVLLGQLETTLTAKGFGDFEDIKKDDHNHFCLKSRKGRRLVAGKFFVHVTMRLFVTNNGTFNVFVQIQ